MKSTRKQLESRWRRDQSAQNLAAAENMTSRYGNTLKEAKKVFSIRIIGEAMNRQAELFWVVHNLTNSGQAQSGFYFSSDQFTAFFRSKIEAICAKLNSTSSLELHPSVKS